VRITDNMPKKMLIDATHAEETRVVVVDGNKVEEFDFESQSKRQLAGNIYLAKVTRVEPSLQAAFVDYGGNRHGFLAFSEIHSDYYQIPVADREALMAEENAYAESIKAEADAEDEEKPKRGRRRRSRGRSKASETASNDIVATQDVVEGDETSSKEIAGMETIDLSADEDNEGESPMISVSETPVETPSADEASEEDATAKEDAVDAEAADEAPAETAEAEAEAPAAPVEPDAEEQSDDEDGDNDNDNDNDDDGIESVADEDDSDDVRPVRKPRPKRYKIQEVIKVRQILLIQVVKEERGNKGAALTTYLSLAGRYCVLMPNTARGGGISRKITNIADRKKLKEIAGEMEVPQGAGLIIRTAGSQRTKAEIRRDYEYLQRMWEQIRELTLKSAAPAKIYEEGDLIKRTIRDLYSKEIDEVIVAGAEGYRTAKDFMKMIMPSHAKNVKPYGDQLPLFARYQVEGYLSGMFNPTVQLPSGGYIVIGVTEALVAVDVNSGRATKEGSIEQTALKTNLEAAEEVARQLRLRDLAGLIVIDFIDMDERKNNTAVEKRMKDKLKTDRARIQVGRISGFGLMEMSRQRLRPGMLEATTQPCPHCHGTGLLRSDDNVSLLILRQLEEEGVRGRTREALVRAPIGIANFLMNQKREHIADIEARYGMAVRIECDPTLVSPDYAIEKFKTATRIVPDASPAIMATAALMDDEDDIVQDTTDEDEAVEAAENGEASEEDKPKRKKRRRRRRRGSGRNGENGENAENAVTADGENNAETATEAKPADAAVDANVEAAPAAETPAETAEEAPVEKPKRKRAPRKKKVEVAAEVTEAPAETVSEAEAAPAAEASAEVAEEAPVEKPKRKRAPRKKKVAEPVVAEVAADEASAVATQDVAAPVVESAPEPAPEPTPAPEPAPEPVAVVPEPAPEPVAEEKPKPKKRGWWSL